MLYAGSVEPNPELLKKLRGSLKLRQVAEQLGYKGKRGAQAVSYWERLGRVPVKHAAAVAKIYGCPIENLPVTDRALLESINSQSITPPDNDAKSDQSEAAMERAFILIGELREQIKQLASRVSALEADANQGSRANFRKPRRR